MKIKIPAVCILVLCFLCGCAGYNEVDNMYTVSALGFDTVSGGYLASVQTVLINQDGELTPQSVVYSAAGNTPQQAVYNIRNSTTRPIDFYHCALIVCSESLDKTQMNEVLQYCGDTREINLAVKAVTADSAEKLLNTKPISYQASGYDIMSMIEQLENSSALRLQSTFHELERNRAMSSGVYVLPYISVTDGGFKFSGGTVYKNDSKKMRLDAEECTVYSIIRNSSVSGNVSISGSGARLNRSHTKVLFKHRGDRICADINTSLNLKYCDDDFLRLFDSAARKLTERAYSEDVDLFGLSETAKIKNVKDISEFRDSEINYTVKRIFK